MSEHNAKIKVIKIKMLGKKRNKTIFWTSKKYLTKKENKKKKKQKKTHQTSEDKTVKSQNSGK